MFIIKADHKHSSTLIASLKDQHNQNIQGYPISSQQAYQMLVDYVPTNNLPSQHDNDGGGISYLQHDDDRTTDDTSRGGSHAGWGGGRSSGRGGRGGHSGGQHASETNHFSESMPNLPNDSEVSELYFVFVVYDMQSGELFIFNISQLYHLSMNTPNAILMHHQDGSVTEFTLSKHGL